MLKKKIPILVHAKSSILLSVLHQHCHNVLKTHFGDTPKTGRTTGAISRALMLHSMSASWNMLTTLLRCFRAHVST